MSENKKIELLSNCTSGGCGAKIGPGELSNILSQLPCKTDENLIVGFDSSDDAAVYKLNEEQAIITTIDFFSPMVNDPKTFGKIAAANALSDVYAMGGKPISALNVVCFPQKLDISILGQILEGGAEKVIEAEAILSGGHSIYDKEPKYGLSVTGIVHPQKVLKNNTPKLGDKLILTKPLGIGIIMAAYRGEMATEEAVQKAIYSMERLNKYASEKMLNYDVHACTDITGFGLLAHILEMASNTISILLNTKNIPYIEEAKKYAEDYLITAAGQRNRNHLNGKCHVENLPFYVQELMFDPQTSGGLLISVSEKDAEKLLKDIQETEAYAKIIGQVISRKEDVILFE